MSSYISDIKDGVKQVLSLYTLKSDIKPIAYTASYNDLKDLPNNVYYDQIDMAVLNFSGGLLSYPYNNGGKINFHYKNKSDITSSIEEQNNKLIFTTGTSQFTGDITTSGTLTVSKKANINGVDLSLVDGFFTIPSYGLSVNGKCKILSTGAINGSTLTLSGAASVASINATNGVVTSTVSSTTLKAASSITSDGTITAGGIITSNVKMVAPTFQGNATSANWADLAEKYDSDKDYPIGTLVQFGGNKEITIANTEVNGVISEKAGYLLNASSNGLPVALCGKVKVLVKGKVKKFDKICLYKNGVGIVSHRDEKIIARALEEKNTEENGLVMCVTQFNL